VTGVGQPKRRITQATTRVNSTVANKMAL